MGISSIPAVSRGFAIVVCLTNSAPRQVGEILWNRAMLAVGSGEPTQRVAVQQELEGPN